MQISDWAKACTLNLADNEPYLAVTHKPIGVPRKHSKITDLIDTESTPTPSQEYTAVLKQDQGSPSREGSVTHEVKKNRLRIKRTKLKIRQFIAQCYGSREVEANLYEHSLGKRGLNEIFTTDNHELFSALSQLKNAENRIYLQLVWQDFPEFRVKHSLLLSPFPTQVLLEHDSMAIMIHKEFFRGRFKATGVRFLLDEDIERQNRLKHVVAYYNPS